MKLLMPIILFFSCSIAYAVEKCIHQIKINGNSFFLNINSANDIRKMLGESEKIKTLYEIPHYDLCYKTKDGREAIIFGFDSNTNLLKSSAIVTWNEVIADHIKCSNSQLSQFSINGKLIGMNIEDHSSLGKTLVSRNYCHVEQEGSVTSGVLVSFGIFLVDLE